MPVEQGRVRRDRRDRRAPDRLRRLGAASTPPRSRRVRPLLDRRLALRHGQGRRRQDDASPPRWPCWRAAQGKRTLVVRDRRQGRSGRRLRDRRRSSSRPREVAAEPLGDDDGHRGVAQGVPARSSCASRWSGASGRWPACFDFVANAAPGVQGDPHRRQARCARCGSATTTSSWSTPPRPATSSASWRRPRPSARSSTWAWCAARREWILEMLQRSGDHRRGRSSTTPEEMPVNETIELVERLDVETTSTWPRSSSTRCCPSCSAGGEEAVFERLRKPAMPKRWPAQRRRRRRAGCGARCRRAGGHAAADAAPSTSSACCEATCRRSVPLLYVPVSCSPAATGQCDRCVSSPTRSRPSWSRAVTARRSPDFDRVRSHRALLAAKEIVIALRVGRGRQDHDRRGRGGDGRGPPRRQGARAHRRSGPPAGQRARPATVRATSRPGSPKEAFADAGVEPTR